MEVRSWVLLAQTQECVLEGVVSSWHVGWKVGEGRDQDGAGVGSHGEKLDSAWAVPTE